MPTNFFSEDFSLYVENDAILKVKCCFPIGQLLNKRTKPRLFTDFYIRIPLLREENCGKNLLCFLEDWLIIIILWHIMHYNEALV